MFSHVAEETTRLSHGFLGALFGLLIVSSSAHFWSLVILCTALYVAFVVNTSWLHLVFKAKMPTTSARGAILQASALVVIETLIVGGVFTFYGLNLQGAIDDTLIVPLRFSLIVYGTFLAWMNMAHLHEIFGNPSATAPNGAA